MHTPTDPMAPAPAFAADTVREVSEFDRQQLADLYRTHHRIIWRTLRRLGFSPESAADATQQAYLIALERLDRIVAGSEKAFLFSTAIFFGRTAFRKERRLELSDDPLLGSDLGRAARTIDDRQLVLQLFDRILADVDPDLLTVFTLYEVEGMTSPEISDLLAIPLGTVASRLRRARELFRTKAEQLETNPALTRVLQQRAELPTAAQDSQAQINLPPPRTWNPPAQTLPHLPEKQK